MSRTPPADWYATLTSTLDALENNSNPSSPTDIQRLADLGTQLSQLTSQINAFPESERKAIQTNVPMLMMRIQTVIDKLDNARADTQTDLSQLRQRQSARRAYQSK